MKLDFEYGHGLMSAELPDNTEGSIPIGLRTDSLVFS